MSSSLQSLRATFRPDRQFGRWRGVDQKWFRGTSCVCRIRENLLILAVAVFEQNQYGRKGTSCWGWSGNTFVVVTGRSVVVSWMILSSLGSRNFGNVRQPDFPLRAAAYPRHMWLRIVACVTCWAQPALPRPTRPFSRPTIPCRPGPLKTSIIQTSWQDHIDETSPTLQLYMISCCFRPPESGIDGTWYATVRISSKSS